MKIFGKTLAEYLRFQGGALALVLGVGVLRLVLSLAGVPNSTAKWASITTAALLGILGSLVLALARRVWRREDAVSRAAAAR